MTTVGRGEDWTGAQLAARLAALEGVAPEPVEYVVCRDTIHADGHAVQFYHVADQLVPLRQDELPRWLERHRLRGADRLALALLLVREVLDDTGLVRECTLERRRGALDGPLHGDPARVEFIGPARMVRLYHALRDGRLAEAAGITDMLPARRHAAEHFAGEQQAVRAQFGSGVRIIDAREPTLFETMAGFDSILHVRLADGRELGCGVLWHGPVPLVMAGAFPRFAAPLVLAPDDEAAVQAVLDRDGLMRHETRLDEAGLAVIARRHGGQELFLLRAAGGNAVVTPYEPDPNGAATEDQARWMRYAETYEHLVMLDAWHDGDSDDLLVVSGEAGGQVWRHHLDRDGVETWRKPDEDAAAGLLHREQTAPGTLAAADAVLPEPEIELEAEPEGETNGEAEGEAEPAEGELEAAASPLAQHAEEAEPAPAGSVLAKVEAYAAAQVALRDAQAAAAAGAPLEAVLHHLRALHPALKTLEAEQAAIEAGTLLRQAEAGYLRPERLGRTLAGMEERVRGELAGTRVVTLAPSQWRHLADPTPFGDAAETAFPEAAYDIEEAASCLALRRPTAAAFHCTRVVECGLAALGVQLHNELAGRDREWASIMALLRGKTGLDQAGLLAALEQVRRCWRDARLVPADKYTESEAERLFAAVGAFIGEVAGLLARRSVA